MTSGPRNTEADQCYYSKPIVPPKTLVGDPSCHKSEGDSDHGQDEEDAEDRVQQRGLVLFGCHGFRESKDHCVLPRGNKKGNRKTTINTC